MEHHPPPQHGYGGLPFGAPQGANPPPPHLPFSYHHQQQPPASPYLPYGFFNPWDPPPPFVPPPSDPELQKRVDKFVEYAVKNGPGFEQMIMEKQRGNPAYAFLFGAPGHSYYRYRLWTSVNDHVGAFNPATPVPFPSFYEQQQHHHHHLQQLQHWQPLLEQVQQESSSPTRFKGLSGPLPTDVAAELQMVLENLTGTKESIKGAKNWFVQRSPFAPALAGALRQRILSLDDVDRQLHVIYLANDILFDSLQRRSNPKELDNEALAFQPVLGHMLATIYHNPQNQEANQSRLQKILQFWNAKEVYNTDIIKALEREMIAGHPSTPHASTLLPERPSAFQLSISSETGQNGV